MRRGEIWWADIPAPVGRRPAILLSRDQAYSVRTSVTVVPITGRARGIAVEVPLEPGDGVPRSCVANTDNITTVEKSRLIKRIGRLPPDKLRAVEDALRFALAL
ncbi:MAG TPA: type II toxin-antitoxin system PemK/MazF family toxin [Actinomycetes bacterium]|nr:type II toxin-antitoxin system PemK/MazF family toxin [Actinomycetes bacterium]